MRNITFLFLLTILWGCNSKAQQNKNTSESFEVSKTDAEWKSELTEMQYFVLREAGTEPSFSSPLNKNTAEGVYRCAACGTPLFKSKHQFNSGTGWPSFDREVKDNVGFSVDYDLGYERTEVHCASCGGHLGHLFNDGPKETTGKRYCINGVSLIFSKNE